jgi:hypothetical protein
MTRRTFAALVCLASFAAFTALLTNACARNAHSVEAWQLLLSASWPAALLAAFVFVCIMEGGSND